MKMLTKICIVCGKEYAKKYTTSIKEWNKSVFCSRKCINKGRIPWNKYLKPIKCLKCLNLFNPREKKTKYCSRKCSPSVFHIGHIPWHNGTKGLGIKLGHKKTIEERKAMAEVRMGSKSHFWKGGVSRENYRLRRTLEYREWRQKVYERDNWTCQKCHQRGGELHPHHIKDWKNYPKSRFDVSNGQTLCIPCHKQTDTYAKNLK